MKKETVLKIRSFNRFYLSLMDFYEGSYMHSDYSMTESRVLYEIYERRECNAEDIVRQLGLDKGYLSRIIKRFEGQGLLQREKSKLDARFYQIRLTEEGEEVAEKLIQETNRKIGKTIRFLSESECAQLEQAMAQIQELLKKT